MRRAADRTGARLMFVCLATVAAATARAGTPVPAWEQSFARVGTPSSTYQTVALRELGDGTRMVVTSNQVSLIAARYAADGSELGTVVLQPAFATTTDATIFGPVVAGPVVIDAFGGVFIGAVAGLESGQFHEHGDAWFMKFDGTTGRPAWPRPAVWSSPTQLMAGPQELFVDDQGNLVASIDVVVSGAVFDHGTLKLDGATGTLTWGPIMLSSVVRTTTALDASGNVFVAVGQLPDSNTSDIAVAKYASATGAAIWGPVTFDSPADESPRDCAVAPNGDLVVVGQYAIGQARGFQALRFDGIGGSLLWGPARWQAPADSNDAPATSVSVSPSGYVYVAGYVSESSSQYTAVIGLSAASGDFAWGPVTLPTQQVALPSMASAGNGDAILSTYSAAFDNGFVDKLLIARLRAADGAVAWGPQEDVIASFDSAPHAIVTSSGSVVSSDRGTTGGAAFIEERKGGDGSILWGPSAVSVGPHAVPSALNDIAVGPDGNVVVTGTTSNDDGTASWATLKYDATTGAALWGPVYFDTHDYGYQNPWQVETDLAGDAIVVGYLNADPQNFDYRLAAVKYGAASGTLLWSNAIVSGFFPHGLAIDAAGNVVVLGQVSTANGYDVAIVKLSGADGHAIWGPVLIDVYAEDYPSNVAVNGNGDVLVSGAGYDPNTGIERWFTAKLSGGSGATLWGPVLSGGVYEAPSWMVLDGSGNAIITGVNEDQAYTARMMTIKYSGATGAPLWGPIYYDSPAQYAGGIWVVADANGDVYSAGISWSLMNNVYNADWVTLKYSGSDGSIAWGPKLFDGPAGASDVVYSVELDAAGNPIVGGNVQTDAHEFAFAALAYEGATGDVLWGPVYAARAADSDVNDMKLRAGTVFLAGTANRAYRTIALTQAFGIGTEDVTPIACGEGVTTPLGAANGTPSYTWTLESGALPSGLTLQSDGSFSGTAGEEGSFAFRAKAQDSVGASASRDFVLDVNGGAFVAINATPGAACAVTLSVAGSWSTYEWLPGGETTPSIVVTPTQTTTYGVRLSDGSGCTTRGSITLAGTALATPGCLAPLLSSVTPSSGPAGGGTAITLAGSSFQTGASVTIGAAAASGATWVSSQEIDASTPSLSPGAAYDVVVSNPDSGYTVLHRAWATDFLDVPPSSIFHDDIIAVLLSGISGGCGAGSYCPTAPVTRAQMAVFLVRAKFGASYVPPPASGTVFIDVPADGFAAAYIEQLAALGITGGCGGGNYCPTAPITRAQMAPLLLRTLLGEKYTPPQATGVFADVPPGSFAADWIEDLHARGITGGCSSTPLLYCPGSSVTRAQMATFIVRTFGL